MLLKKVNIILLQLICAFTISESIFVENGAYENIVIEIKENVPFAECSEFLWSLEVRHFNLLFYKYYGRIIFWFLNSIQKQLNNTLLLTNIDNEKMLIKHQSLVHENSYNKSCVL